MIVASLSQSETFASIGLAPVLRYSQKYYIVLLIQHHPSPRSLTMLMQVSQGGIPVNGLYTHTHTHSIRNDPMTQFVGNKAGSLELLPPPSCPLFNFLKTAGL